MSRRRTREEIEEEEEDLPIGRRKTRRQTWLSARHLALNADEQLQLRQLNGQYDSIVVSKTNLSLQMSISIIAPILLAKIRGISFGTLIRSNRMIAVVLSLFATALIDSRAKLCDTQMKIDDLTLLFQSDYVIRALSPKQRRSIDDLADDTEAELFTRFRKDELHKLFDHLRFPPGNIRIAKHVFTSEEIFLFTLTWIARGETFVSMRDDFGGDSNSYGYMVGFFIEHVFETFYHKISGDSMRMWKDDIDEFRERIWEDCCFDRDDNGMIDHSQMVLDIALDVWRVWSFIDCCCLKTCRPGSGPINEDGDRREDANDMQQAFYS